MSRNLQIEEYRRLQRELQLAIKSENQDLLLEIANILNVPSEQANYFSKGLTGYPSIDKPWLNYYPKNAEDDATKIPQGKTVWDVIEEQLHKYYNYPAIEYFKYIISREEFSELCYVWARTFRAMGVSEGDVVPIYGPFVPDICAMTFALNMIGACPYFLKLAIDDKSLEEETRNSKVAVVFDRMWGNVYKEFSKPKFKNIIVASAATDMPSPKSEIMSFLNMLDAIKTKSRIPNEKKYIWADRARDLANYYSGKVKADFKKNRPAFTTSSSGTTGGEVKGTIATNEATISQLLMGDVSGVQYFPGDKCLNNFPPTASTSLNALFMLPLFKGETILLDPRVSKKAFYNQIVNLRPNIVLSTGSMWEEFFNRVEREMAAGKKFDFSFAKGWTIGGEGTDVFKFIKWNIIMQQCGAKGIYIGYGLSELFSAVSVETVDARADFSKPIISVGIPYAGITVGIFDKDGNELSYNQRGEIWIRSNSAMLGYYNKPDLTAKKREGDWIKTGDLGEIDERGFLYVWGRIDDKIKLSEGSEIYLFDIALKIKEDPNVLDAIALPMPTPQNPNNLVVHIVWKNNISKEARKQSLSDIPKKISETFSSNISVSAFAIHDEMLPYSPTTLKKDKNSMAIQLNGYIKLVDDKIVDVVFLKNGDGTYTSNEVIYDNGLLGKFKKLALKK